MEEGKYYVAIDCEGDAGQRGLLGVAFFDGTQSCYLTDHNDIERRLKEYARQGADFVAHNAIYEIAVIFWQLRLNCRAVYYNGRLHHGIWYPTKKHQGNKIWDTLSISAHMSLAKVGQAIGLEKYETPQILLGEDPVRYKWKCDLHNVWECVSCYSIRDAEIAWHYFKSYRQTLSTYGVTPKHTLGSAAVAIWRKLDRPGDVSIKSRELSDFIRKSYHGGRTEVFKYGLVELLHTADVQSMYPSVMLNEPYPDTTKLFQLYDHNRVDVVRDTEGVSECDIWHPNLYVPCLPVMHDDKLMFPVGHLHGVWTHVELRAALDRGCRIERIQRSVIAQGTRYPFTNYVSAIKALRDDYKHNGDPREYTAKILANSLYGRMGLRGDQTQETVVAWDGVTDPNDYKGFWADITKYGVIFTLETSRQAVSRDANILWAAYITAYARTRLLHYLELQDNALVYCDTDSIYSTLPIAGTEEGFGNLNADTTYDKGLFLAPKLYRLEKYDGGVVVRARGIPNRVAEDFFNKGEATFSSVISPKQAIRRNLKPGEWVEITRRNMPTLAKRQLLDPSVLLERSGYSDTVPLVMSLSDPPWRGYDVEDLDSL